MSGIYNGLQASIRNQTPFTVYVPILHSLNFVEIPLRNPEQKLVAFS